jgi:hypothetical protein
MLSVGSDALADRIQGVDDSTVDLAVVLDVRAEVKMLETIIAHVKADHEKTPQPPTWRAKC